jgi:SAM-dependent methyltransferase
LRDVSRLLVWNESWPDFSWGPLKFHIVTTNPGGSNVNAPEVMKKDTRAFKLLLDSPTAFSRLDETPDRLFYSRQRMVAHLDGLALKTVSLLIESLIIESEPAVLDLMASWDSHLPESLNCSELVGLGMNDAELLANTRLTERVIHDLNENPTLPFEKERFDIVLNTVSIDYLTDPQAVINDVARVLKPGGLFLVIFSNRWFPQKVTRAWQEMSEDDRMRAVGHWLSQSAQFDNLTTFASMGKPRLKDDPWVHLGLPSDPVFAVYGEKIGAAADHSERPKISLHYGDDLSPEELAKRIADIENTWSCPYCQQKLAKWKISDNPFTTYDHDFMYICLNDACDYLVRGFDQMFRQGNVGISYRVMYNPVNKKVKPCPVPSLNAIKDEVVVE